MQDISALTPPLLMLAVILLAIGAFLRHEMGRKRREDIDQPRDIPGAPAISDQAVNANAQESATASPDDDER
jgi:hypothetical protein